ncbi:hypothetical protein HPB47_000937 [Ixodes persulcatus]|uniref:Uncharacterized protein n=1 Tax=Ixodes persulcatus TaxID=34615 RepID=A0AC60PQH2_IXOPE|nr:hypothetical protein HPB47_000937 [Ixodes persulcatus]
MKTDKGYRTSASEGNLYQRSGSYLKLVGKTTLLGSRGPSTRPSYAARSAAAATTTATGRRPTKTRTATKVHLSVTLPATAPGVPTRPQAAGPHRGSLLIVYGLSSNKMNAEKLFNLLCLYGDVVNITEEQERLCHGADGGPPGQAESSASPKKRTVLQHQEAARVLKPGAPE